MEQFPPKKKKPSKVSEQIRQAKKKMTSKLVGDIETQSHGKPHPQEKDPQPGENSKPRAFPWRVKS